MTKTLLRALAGETLPTPPVWMMRQAGRYLPEYRATRAQAGDFLSLCYNPDLAAEVTLQPIRRYGFDAAILFADILLLPQAMGLDLWFVTGEGPRLSTATTAAEVAALKGPDDIHDVLSPVYETVSILSRELPPETALIGFAGARVIEQTIREKLPEGFQRAEYLKEHGMVDMVVHRLELKDTLVTLCRILMKAPAREPAPDRAAPAPGPAVVSLEKGGASGEDRIDAVPTPQAEAVGAAPKTSEPARETAGG